MDVLSKREPIIGQVSAEKGVDPTLIIALLTLEQEFTNLHAHGARPRMRRAAERLVDESLKGTAEADGA